MDKITNAITTYNLFNYLFPGVLFVLFLEYFTKYSFIGDTLITDKLELEHLLIGFFPCYFIGMVISRIGSFLNDGLKKIRFIHFSQYEDFTTAEKKDPKISILSEQSNQYRSILALLIIMALTKIWSAIFEWIDVSQKYELYVLVVFLFILFLFSYRKQVIYINRRIDKFLKKS